MGRIGGVRHGLPAIIVLSAGILTDFKPNVWSRLRCTKALDLYKVLVDKYRVSSVPIIVTTRYRKNTKPLIDDTDEPVSECIVLADFIAEQAKNRGIMIPKHKILIENKSQDELSSAYYCKMLFTDPLNLRHLYIVTNECHLSYTRLVFNHVYIGGEYMLEYIPVSNVEIPEKKMQIIKEQLLCEYTDFANLMPHLRSDNDLHKHMTGKTPYGNCGIVVLCGGIVRSTDIYGATQFRPNEWSKERCCQAIRLYNSLARGINANIIISTKYTVHLKPFYDDFGNPILESQIMADYMISQFKILHGITIPRSSIYIEDISQDTIGNAYYTQMLFTEPLNIRHLYIITSEFHMQRTQMIFDWIYGFTPGKYTLEYIATDNIGLSSKKLVERREKEIRSCTDLRKKIMTIKTLGHLHRWMYRQHDLYRYRQEPLPLPDTIAGY